MKPARSQESKCRRLELKCKLFDLIKELEHSMVAECNNTQADPQIGIFAPKDQETQRHVKKAQVTECCCPAGCCKESLAFKSPKGMGPSSAANRSAGDDQAAPSDYEWHDHDHSRGCRPARGGPGGPGGRSPAQQATAAFDIPRTPEEAIQAGCFVARTCQ